MAWQPKDCRELAAAYIGETVGRWEHVQQVAHVATSFGASQSCVASAWLHDIGYAPQLDRTGLHAVDGALFLDMMGAPRDVVSLVAFHSGAEFEALERGLIDELLPFDRPDQDELDMLIFADMSVGPDGQPMSVDDRIDEILTRYEPQHPVHRAVTKSREYLEECCGRATQKVRYPM